MIPPEDLRQKAQGHKKHHKKAFQQMVRLPEKELDLLFHEAHEEVFACTDCLQCANCCKTTGPLFTDKDIQRIARHLSMKPGDFVSEFLRVDDEGDYVLKTVPCAFLGEDNRCSIYDVRPRACREFPHTDRRNMKEILELTLKNVAVCPAVFEIVEKISDSLRN